MPRLVNRKKFEAIIRRRFINVGKEHVDKMLDLLGTPPDVDNIPQAFWRGMGRELRGAIQPVLNDIYLASAEAVAESTALATGIDWTLVNTSAASWAKDYSSELVKKVTRTTKAKLRGTISDFFTEQRTVGATEAEIRKLLPDLRMANGRILTSAQRAKLTATTEVTRASVEGERAIIGEIEADGIEMIAVWDTQNDAKVCFRGKTPIATERGRIAIDRVVVGDMVLTRLGYCRVLEVLCRDYTGEMVVVKHRQGSFCCTVDHPVWVLDQGWLDAGDIKPGDSLNTFGNERSPVVGVFKIGLGDSDYVPAVAIEEPIFSNVPGGVSVPVGSVNFEGDSVGRYQKVNTVSAHLRFLNVLNFENIKSKSNALFEKVFTAPRNIARITTKATIRIRRDDSQFLAACNAGNIDGRAATLLGAVVSIVSFFSSVKKFSTSLAGVVFLGTFFAGEATNSVPICIRGIHCELFPANRTGLGHFRSGLKPAFIAAKLLSPFNATRRKVKVLLAIWAGQCFTSALSLCWTKLEFFRGDWHGLLTHFRIHGLYHNGYPKSIKVYNLRVEGDPVYFAGFGSPVLVHNCEVCGARHDKEQGNGWTEPPPAHPGCYCSLRYVPKSMWERGVR